MILRAKQCLLIARGRSERSYQNLKTYHNNFDIMLSIMSLNRPDANQTRVKSQLIQAYYDSERAVLMRRCPSDTDPDEWSTIVDLHLEKNLNPNALNWSQKKAILGI